MSGIDSYTKLMLHMDADWTDSSSVNLGSTDGGAAISDDQSVFGGASGYFYNATRIYDNSAGLQFGSGDFTIDFRLYYNSSTGYNVVVRNGEEDGRFAWQFYFDALSSYTFAYSVNGTNLSFISDSCTLEVETWYHVAISRTDGKIYFFLDGQLLNTGGTTFTDTLYSTEAGFTIGQGGGQNPDCYIDELRISKGIARWIDDFDIPTEAYSILHGPLYEVGVGKEFLTIQSALDQLYIDVGVNAFTETKTVMVYDGTYTETAIPNTSLMPTTDYRLIITAATGNSPVVDATGFDYCFDVTIPYTTINGFTCINATNAGIYYHFIYNICEGIVSNNICYSNGLYGIHTSGNPTLTIIRNTCRNNGSVGIYSIAGSIVSFISNICYSNGTHGIDVDTCPGYVAHDNICYTNGGHGMYFRNDAPYGGGASFYNNHCYSNTGDGIALSVSYNSSFHSNTSNNNTGNGIGLDATNGLICRNNLCYSNDKGIYSTNGDSTFYNNLCCLNTTYGMEFASMSNSLCYNNTIYSPGVSIALTGIGSNLTFNNNIMCSYNYNWCIEVATSCQSGFVSNNNTFWSQGALHYVGAWGITLYTLADWITNVGQDAVSISADPLFVNQGGINAVDYKITLSSPCIDKGVDLGAPYNIDYFGRTRTAGVAWDIGFYEVIRIATKDGLLAVKTSNPTKVVYKP